MDTATDLQETDEPILLLGSTALTCFGANRVDSNFFVPVQRDCFPRLCIERDVPSIVDACGADNTVVYAAVTHYSITSMISFIFRDCSNFLMETNNLSYGDILTVNYGALVDTRRDEMIKIVDERFTHVFPSEKNRQWVKQITATLVQFLVSQPDYFHCESYDFVQSHMTPYIDRNFCTMVPEGMEKTLNSFIQVPVMYEILYTFLKGSKRKQSKIHILGSDIIRKIFDFLDIRTTKGLRWSSFQTQLQKI
jgi:hypothetical protein